MLKIKTVVFLFITLLLSAIIGYLSRPYIDQRIVNNEYTQTNNKNENNSEMNSQETHEQEMQEQSSSTTAFRGRKISAILPQGWTITEYFNGNGSSMLTAGSMYQGLTGIEITNASNVVIFKIEAVSGVGGVDACSEYYKFADNSTQYYNKVLSDAQTVGLNVNVIDLSTQVYSEFTLLNKNFRRIGNNLYWDTISTNDTFDAACGIESHIIQFPCLTFSVNGIENHGYQFSIENSPNEQDLSVLDDILNSIQCL